MSQLFPNESQGRAVVAPTFWLLQVIGLSSDRLQHWRSSLCNWCQPVSNHLVVPRYKLQSYKMFKGANCHPAQAHQGEKKRKCHVWWRFLFNSAKAASQSADQHDHQEFIQPSNDQFWAYKRPHAPLCIAQITMPNETKIRSNSKMSLVAQMGPKTGSNSLTRNVPHPCALI